MRLAMNKRALVVGFLVIAIGSAAAQDRTESALAPTETPASEETVHVRVSTNSADALLFADSVLIGRVPSGFVSIPPETERLRLTIRDAKSWSIQPVEKRLDAAVGDSIEIHLNFPYHYRIESIPFGAKVHVEQGKEWDYLGSTPLLHTTNAPLDNILVIEHAGYVLERLDPGLDIWNRHVIMLKPSDELDPTAAQVNWKPPKQRRAWIDYAALGTALAAGMVAVHYKFKADDLYSRYEDTADPALRDDIHAYDVRSGVAFGVMQGGLGLFAIRLILR